jgi:hypothetical protein
MIIDHAAGKRLDATLRRLPSACLDASAVGQFNAAQLIMETSKSRAPFEHGDLEAAAYVEDPNFTAKSAAVEFGYAGVPYMVVQHEGAFNHPGLDTQTKNMPRAQQGERKFLETAVNDRTPDAEAAIRAAVQFYMRTGKLPAMRGAIGAKK